MIISEKNLAALDKRSSKPEQIYAILKKSILDGTIAAGTHLTETELCQDLNISRTPVHQAVVQLEAEHLVQILPRKGLMVLEINPRDIMNLYDVAQALESTAARLAASSRTAYHIQQMERYSAPNDTGDPMQEPEQYDSNYMFHMAIAEASGNDVLLNYIKMTRERLSLLRFCKFFRSIRGTQLGDEAFDHLHILDAIKRHDGDTAERLMRQHIAVYSQQVIANMTFSGPGR